MSWQLHPRSPSALAADASSGDTGMQFPAVFPFLLHVYPLCPLRLQWSPTERQRSPRLKNDLRIQLETLNLTECFWQGSVPSIKTQRD